jgi:hypothetical protein
MGAGPPAGGISNPHPHIAGAGAGPSTGGISDPHPHPSGLKSADTRIRGCNCHPYTPSILVTIKGGGMLPLRGIVTYVDIARSHPLGRTQHSAPLSTRYWHSPQSTSPLAETWELPSLSRLACTPYYRHLRCKIIQCPRTPPCWTYGPAAGTSINPCVTVLPLASISVTRKHAALLVGVRTAGSGRRHLSFIWTCICSCHLFGRIFAQVSVDMYLR